eukprot:CAMPEP_0201285192 /NCGR_PEP_ID=MMETSP1317-20130820/98425_1 /ASSEMBLY_ACC=CAM_ASM_000770 /TAXON_ID=187299 /ORGANISM="Undescribed Undescribed, Strain Undescribed" /LENGTH=47 /DNA_ID= /DNA_START= /DNA_END= /DNA_ORIENTATION=
MDELIILMRSALSSINVMAGLRPPGIAEIEASTKEFFGKADTNKDNE